MDGKYRYFVGIDWATEAHQVCVLDSDRSVIKELVVEHSGTALAALVEVLAGLAPPQEIAVGIEVPRGAVVETLMERGFVLHHINPKQMDRFRDRHGVAGAKDDRRDAFVLADSLRTDQHCFRRVASDDPHVIELRELVRVDDDLQAEVNVLSNRIREQLLRYFPAYLKLSSMDEEWAWALWELCSTPTAAQRLSRARVAALLKQHRIRRVNADAVLAALKQPPLHVAQGTVEAAYLHIRLALPRLRLAVTQQRQVRSCMKKLLERMGSEAAPEGQEVEHRDAQILLSMPGVGTKVAATVLVEASTALAERDYHALRAHAGVAPVTIASGKRSKGRARVQMRHACNKRLRNVVYHWARVSTVCDDRARTVYAALRARGHTHGRALRSIADHHLRVLVAMLRTHTLYQPPTTTEPSHAAA